MSTCTLQYYYYYYYYYYSISLGLMCVNVICIKVTAVTPLSDFSVHKNHYKNACLKIASRNSCLNFITKQIWRVNSPEFNIRLGIIRGQSEVAYTVNN